MATKEDILEQLVEEYLLHEGYFVQHNIKFRPRDSHPDFHKQIDSNHSDIDILGIHPLHQGHKKIVAVSCKSWQAGFDPRAEIEAIEGNKIVSGRERWKAFREISVPKWSEAFIDTIETYTGSRKFTYITAVTKIRGNPSAWSENISFQKALENNKIEVIDMEFLLSAVLPKLTTTVANTNIGRMLQLIKAAGLEITKPKDISSKT